MTDDSKLVDAYKSMYEHHQKDADGKVIEHDDKEQLDEALPLALGAVAKGIGTAMKVARVVGAVKNTADAAGNVMNKVTGRGQKHPDKMQEDVAITHLDGSTTEIVDVVTPEPLGNPDENLADRLWDQVAANLTTLGEMAGVRYQVSPVEELQEKKKKKGKKLDPVGKEDADIDNDGDVDDSDSYLHHKLGNVAKRVENRMSKLAGIKEAAPKMKISPFSSKVMTQMQILSGVEQQMKFKDKNGYDKTKNAFKKAKKAMMDLSGAIRMHGSNLVK